jgi:hypothetical protein
MLDWIVARVLPGPVQQHGMTDDDAYRVESHRLREESRKTVDRVNRVVNRWHEQTDIDPALVEVEARKRALELSEEDKI